MDWALASSAHHTASLYTHTGGMPGVNTVLHYQPDTSLTVVVLANNDAVDASAIANGILHYAHDRSLKLAHEYAFLADAGLTHESALLGRYSDGQNRAGQMRIIDGALHVVPTVAPCRGCLRLVLFSMCRPSR